jgi:hypothetical protein
VTFLILHSTTNPRPLSAAKYSGASQKIITWNPHFWQFELSRIAITVHSGAVGLLVID